MYCLICNAEVAPGSERCPQCGSPLTAQLADSAGELAPGTLLHDGVYRVEGVLGAGGFGITYRAVELRRERSVAIKEFFPGGCVRIQGVVHPTHLLNEADYQEARRKFLEEARWLSRFDNPHIVRVIASFTANNTAYMVMEFLDGLTLQKVLEKHGVIPEPEAVGYIDQIGHALESLHEAKLLHRDIKPENIMLRNGLDGKKQAVLIDFGSAREFAAGVTKRMTTILTPGYAPLEQYGQRARFGTFTDIYSLGATLYHLLTGETPVQSTDRASGEELRSPDVINPYVSHTVSLAVMSAMQMKVADRPQRVRDFLNALHGNNHGEAIFDGVPNEPASGNGAASDASAPLQAVRGAYKVMVLSSRVKWPHKCACCGGPGPVMLTTNHGEGTWEIPYCPSCKQHAEGADAANEAAGWVMWLGGAAGLGVGIATEVWWVGAIVAAATALAGSSLRDRAVTRSMVRVRPACAAVGPAVSYEGRQGRADVFLFKNQAYAEEFRIANAGHVV